MASGQYVRADWRDPELVKTCIDLCLEEVNEVGKRGNSLHTKSWHKIAKKFLVKKGIKMSQKQLRNEWDYLKMKYSVWSAIMKKAGNDYNPVTNTVNWDAEQWDDYIKAVPKAKQFRYVGLEWSDELRALFDGIIAIRKDGSDSSKERLAIDCIGSSSIQGTARLSQMHIDHNPQSSGTPTSSPEVHLPKEKRRKKSTAINLDKELPSAINIFKSNEGPSIDDCNGVLNKVKGLQMNDPLYIVSTCIFCESKAHREQWMMFDDKPDALKLKWIDMIGKRLGFHW